MTSEEIRKKVVEQAEQYKGIVEGSTEHKFIVDTYNSIKPLPVGYKLKYTDAWCAGFVSAIGQLCGLTTIIYPECSCSRMLELFKQHNRFIEDDNYIPSPADIIFYDWQDTGEGDNKGQPDHVGIVVDIDKNQNIITVIEGNKNDQVDTRKIGIGRKFIRGYGIPDYENYVLDSLSGQQYDNFIDKINHSLDNLVFNSKDDELIKDLARSVMKYMKQYNYKGFASAIVAHGINESGWNTSKLSKQYNNIWGLKCGSGWTGKSVNLNTREEYEEGVLVDIKANFRVYDTFDDGVRGFFEFIQYPRYKNLYEATSPINWMELLKQDSFFTSSTQVDTVGKIILKYDLYILDDLYNSLVHDEIDTLEDKIIDQTEQLLNEKTVDDIRKEFKDISDKILAVKNINSSYKIVCHSLNIRKGPDKSYGLVSAFTNGERFIIDLLVYKDNGDIWGKIKGKNNFICLYKVIKAENYGMEVAV